MKVSKPQRVAIFGGLTLSLTLLLASFAVSSAGATTVATLLYDAFNRPDAAALGSPWTEVNEVTTEVTDATGFYEGPGYIEVNNNV